MKRSISEGLDATNTDSIRSTILGAKIATIFDGDLTAAERTEINGFLTNALDALYAIVTKPVCNLGPNGGPCDPKNERRA